MFERLNDIDTALFLWVNSHHNTVLDWLLWTLSQHWSWAIVLLLFFGTVTLRHEPRRWWVVLVSVMLCFLLADQGSGLIKDWVCRLRPCHALDDVRMFRTHCGGQYGFVSSHAANAFAVVAFLWLRYHRRFRIGTVMMLVWAMAVCYSRAYLGKHYPGDLLCGAVLGIIVGTLIWWVAMKTETAIDAKKAEKTKKMKKN